MEINIVMLGLDGSGKTTMLYKLMLNAWVATIATIGFNVESIEREKDSLSIWDVGGKDKIRALWKHYYPKS